jgi:hypothetical protein
MAEAFSEFTRTPGVCWFAVWEGFDDVSANWQHAPRFEIPARRMLLLRGTATDASVPLADEPWEDRSANLWWPDDHSWCVGTDVDLMTTYVGASARCVEALLADPRLEALRVSPDQAVTWDADGVNPLPPPPAGGEQSEL